MMVVYKGNGDALACGSFRGIRLLEHAMKVLERVIEGRVRKIVKIDNLDFFFFFFLTYFWITYSICQIMISTWSLN